MTREYANKTGFFKIVEAWQNGHEIQVRHLPKGRWENCSLRFAMDCNEQHDIRVKPISVPPNVVSPSEAGAAFNCGSAAGRTRV